MSSLRPRWSSRTKLTIIIAIVALGVYLLFRFRDVLAPMVLAIILAYVLSPAVSLVQIRLKLNRTPATIVIYLLVIAVLAALLVAIIPSLAAQLTGLNVDIQRFLQAIETALDHSFIVAGQVIEVGELYRQFVGSLQGILEPLFGQTLGFAFDVLSSFVWVIFVFVVSFYLIKDGPALREWLEGVVPPVYRSDFIHLRDEISQIWAAFFRGQLVLALVVMLMFTVIGFVLGLPFALAMAVFAGLMEFLPSVGHAIWLFVASVLAFFIGSAWIPLPNWVFMLIVIGLHLVFGQFDLNYLIPRIIGRRVHLPPLVVILGIVTGAVLAGVLGILLAAPTIASARVLGRYIYANLFDMEPFPDSIVPPLPAPNPKWWRRMLDNWGQKFVRSK
ncbi:MAG TPA: AI-2E family transporter [Anaerolineales bacterium]|nr:AI-2E family transporter [Anaerolineales bacterium]